MAAGKFQRDHRFGAALTLLMAPNWLLLAGAAIANPDGEAPVALSAITTPPAKMATANLLDANGQTVGAVQRVDRAEPSAPLVVAADEAAFCTAVSVVIGGTDE